MKYLRDMEACFRQQKKEKRKGNGKFYLTILTDTDHVFELRQYSDLLRQIKEPQNSIYC